MSATNWLRNHFFQSATLPGMSLAYGALAAWGIAVMPRLGVVDFSSGEEAGVALLLFPLMALPGLVVLAVQLFRPLGRTRGTSSTCDLCGAHASTTDVRILKITGAFVVMVTHQLAARTCRRCGLGQVAGAILHTLALGWWGLFSFFITPGIVMHDLAMVLRLMVATRPTPRADA